MNCKKHNHSNPCPWCEIEELKRRIEQLTLMVSRDQDDQFQSYSTAPTEPQLKVIRYIEANLGISFTGVTKQDAKEWISQHMDASKKSRRVTTRNREEDDFKSTLQPNYTHDASYAGNLDDWFPGHTTTGDPDADRAMDELWEDRVMLDKAFDSYAFSD